MIYRLILKGRDNAYAKGRRKSENSPVPTVCIGNVTVGGTGKTPHTEMVLGLLEDLDCFRGYSIAVLSRGYKRRSKGFLEVPEDGTAREFGDEPLQIKKNFPDVCVAVDKDRIEGCRRLVKEKNANLIVLDDAFQYRKLKANLNIVLVDSTRPVWKDRLLPFGRLRDLPERIYEADCIIVTKCSPDIEDADREGFAASLGLKDYDSYGGEATTPSGKRINLFFTKIEYCAPEMVFPDGEPRYIYCQKTVLFSGIANDAPLRAHLGDITRVVASMKFPDHHNYSRKDIRKILAKSGKHPVSSIATTQKDAQRLYGMRKIPSEFRNKLFMVPIKAAFCSDKEQELFRNVLRNQLYGGSLF